ncbi:MAG: UDP-N-acetylglucosamine 2-epimerase (hydrolyzing) [Proteobacteria bacterium]|nr:UDP-N-acetylglucosamine 2-epimerase (hydrolyzing) [Pseudomonadota bacterium]
MKRTICVVTGTRAEYGLLRWVMAGIRESQDLDLQVIVTGMHLSPEFGLTYREIEADGFCIDAKVEMLLSSDTPAGVAKSMGLGMIGLADALQRLRPDVLLLLGDRFEILAAATAAMVARIPIAHLHGGESTEGLIDESIRHSITKMAQLHFVALEEYRDRVIQLGEQPDRVFLVGGLGVDAIGQVPLLDRAAVEQRLGCTLASRSLLITFHPVTLETDTSASQMSELLAALAERNDTTLLFTLPNADTDGRVLIEMINRFVATHANSRAYTSLGQLLYLSCVNQVDAVVGNSSSGLTEVPSFHKGTINIGDRQRGRLKAASVVDCLPERSAIAAAIERVRSPEFRAGLQQVRNPYGDGGASKRIVEILARTRLDDILKKRFFDVPLR